jgi:hypothetical protein
MRRMFVFQVEVHVHSATLRLIHTKDNRKIFVYMKM